MLVFILLLLIYNCLLRSGFYTSMLVTNNNFLKISLKAVLCYKFAIDKFSCLGILFKIYFYFSNIKCFYREKKSPLLEHLNYFQTAKKHSWYYFCYSVSQKMIIKWQDGQSEKISRWSLMCQDSRFVCSHFIDAFF